MSLPLNALSTPARPADLLSPDSIQRVTRIVDYERGGIALSDPSQGLNVQDWRLRLVGNEVRVSPEPYTTETVLFTGSNITELALAFDQNMRPAVAYMQLGQAKLYWFDSFVAMQVTTILDPAITSVTLTLDDKRAVASQTNTNDILLFYVLTTRLCYRQQRDRFVTERTLAWLEGNAVTIKRAGMNRSLRVQIELVGLQAGLAIGAVLGVWREAVYSQATTVANTMPAAIEAGDLLYAALFHRSAVTPPAGWTLVTSQACAASSTTQTLSVFSKTSVAPADSGVSVTFTQAASDRMGLAYFAVRGTPGTTPTYIGATASTVSDVATNTATAPTVTAAASELIVTLATSINGNVAVTRPAVAAGMGLISGAASGCRLGVAYQRRKVGQTNAGRFTFDNGTPTNNGLAAPTMRFGT